MFNPWTAVRIERPSSRALSPVVRSDDTKRMSDTMTSEVLVLSWTELGMSEPSVTMAGQAPALPAGSPTEDRSLRGRRPSIFKSGEGSPTEDRSLRGRRLSIFKSGELRDRLMGRRTSSANKETLPPPPAPPKVCQAHLPLQGNAHFRVPRTQGGVGMLS